MAKVRGLPCPGTKERQLPFGEKPVDSGKHPAPPPLLARGCPQGPGEPQQCHSLPPNRARLLLRREAAGPRLGRAAGQPGQEEQAGGREKPSGAKLETLQLLEVLRRTWRPPPPPPAKKHAGPQRGEGGSERHGAPPALPLPPRLLGGTSAAGQRPVQAGRRGLVSRQVTPPSWRSSGSLRGRGPIIAPCPGSGQGRKGASPREAPAKGAPLGSTGRLSRGRQHEGARQPLNSRRVAARSRRPRARLTTAACLPRQRAHPAVVDKALSPRPPPGQPRRGSGGGSSKARPASPGTAAAAYLLPSRLRPSAPHRGRGGRARGRIRPELRSRAELADRPAGVERGAPFGGDARGASRGAGSERDRRGGRGKGRSRRRPRAPCSGISRTDRSPPVFPLGRPPGRLPEGQGSAVLPTESEPSPPRPPLPLTPKLGKPRGRRPASGFSSGKAASGPAPSSACAPAFREGCRQGRIPERPGGFPSGVRDSKQAGRPPGGTGFGLPLPSLFPEQAALGWAEAAGSAGFSQESPGRGRNSRNAGRRRAGQRRLQQAAFLGLEAGGRLATPAWSADGQRGRRKAAGRLN
ncbi:basic salivary proline-rich protein 2-like [Pantherophis guttatus]|uniref:Basic salivary proline-rich protein 2-like n=1 Tax=Pantherophis guttatus TaxID=94885 RepID=A0ABM3ZGM5_PANGU|nr:basic salivary proline-rich protein 2-like [Pantherophis guttatus]